MSTPRRAPLPLTIKPAVEEGAVLHVTAWETRLGNWGGRLASARGKRCIARAPREASRAIGPPAPTSRSSPAGIHASEQPMPILGKEAVTGGVAEISAIMAAPHATFQSNPAGPMPQSGCLSLDVSVWMSRAGCLNPHAAAEFPLASAG